MTLDQIQPTNFCVILSTGGEKIIRRRLLDMGLTPKTKILVHKVAPMGDPMEIYLRGYALTLRKEEAKHIQVQEVS